MLRYNQYALIIYWYLFNTQYCHTKSKPRGLGSSLGCVCGSYRYRQMPPQKGFLHGMKLGKGAPETSAGWHSLLAFQGPSNELLREGFNSPRSFSLFICQTLSPDEIIALRVHLIWTLGQNLAQLREAHGLTPKPTGYGIFVGFF